MRRANKHPKEIPDSEIYHGILEGSTKHKGYLYLKYSDDIMEYGHYRTRGRNKELIEDLMHDTMITCIENIQNNAFTPDHEKHILKYLKKTFFYKFTNHLNSKKPALFDVINLPIPDSLDLEIDLLEMERKAKQALNIIREKCRIIIVSTTYDNLSMKALAEKYEFISSERNARQYKHRCMEDLRKIFIRILKS